MKDYAEKKLKERIDPIKELIPAEFLFDFNSLMDSWFNENSPICKMEQWIEEKAVDMYDVDGWKFKRGVILKFGYRDKKELNKHMEQRFDEYEKYVKDNMDCYLGKFAEEIDNIFGNYCQQVLKANEEKYNKQKKLHAEEVKNKNKEIQDIETILAVWSEIRDESMKYLSELKN